WRPSRTTTVRSGRLPATGPDVRSDRAGRSGRGFRGTAGPDEEAAWGRPRPRDTRVRDGRDRSGVQGTGPGQDRPTVPPGPLAAARGGGERGLPVVGEPESPGVPTVLQDLWRARNGREHPSDGLREHGKELRFGSRIHTGPLDGQEA